MNRRLLTSAIALSVAASTAVSTAAYAQHDNRRESRHEQRQEARPERHERQEARPQRQERPQRVERAERHENRGMQSGNNPGRHAGWERGVGNPHRADAARADRRQDAIRADRRQDAIRADRRQDAARADRRQDAIRQDRRQDARRDAARQDRRQDAIRADRRQDARQDMRRAEARQDLRQARRWNNVNDRRWYESRWNNRARNFNTAAYRRAWVSPQRYRYNGWYAYPRGYYYRRWNVGLVFPSLFWASSNYYIDSWYNYGLASPPWGYEWVRYGPDAVLVDVRSGVILQVRYGVFY